MQRLPHKERKAQILAVAAAYIKEYPKEIKYGTITREWLAEWCKCAPGTINYAFVNMDGFRKAIVIHGKKTKHKEIIRQAKFYNDI